MAFTGPAPKQYRRNRNPLAHEWIDVAADLGVPVIRYFAARKPPELDLESSIQAVGEMLALLSEHAEKANVKIGVETHKGAVSLSGAVDTAQQKELAIQLARGIDGVRSVSNQLSVRQ